MTSVENKPEMLLTELETLELQWCGCFDGMRWCGCCDSVDLQACLFLLLKEVTFLSSFSM
jgi:hypothetical protein